MTALPAMRSTWRRVKLSLVRERAENPYMVRCAGDVVGLVRSFIAGDPRERFVAVYLDAKHRPIAVHEVSTGTANSSLVHPREVFGPALQLAAVALVVAHNHPSGDPTPSAEDRAVTERLKSAAEILGITFLDHIVIGDRDYFTIAEGCRRPLPASKGSI